MRRPSEQLPNFGKKTGPMGSTPSDDRPTMHPFNQGRGPLPDQADDPAVTELLAHWDELPVDGLANVTAHPVHGQRLEMLRAADAWLLQPCGAAQEANACPSAEHLFDFAKGPGYGPLSRDVHKSILDHVTECAECASLVESLETSPPVPLNLTGDPSDSAAQSRRPHRAGRPTLLQFFPRLVPLAAALLALVGGLAMFQQSMTSGSLPAYPLLRGAAHGKLLFPRGPVLGAITDQGMLFEVSKVEGASEYTFTLLAHTGDAFAEGEVLHQARSGSPSTSVEIPLLAGHYTWEASAWVNGLEQPLGERDFRVVEDAALMERLRQQSQVNQIRSLHSAGYWTDARAAARRLPPSTERDLYLGSTPGR